MNIACYASGKATRVKKILSAADDNIIKDIKAVICDSINWELEKILIQKGIQYIFIETSKISENKGAYFSDKLLETLEKYQIDYLFVFGIRLLKGKILEKYRWKIINFHPSLLPMFKGMNAIDQAVAAKMPYVGNTAHFIDESADGGPIIMQNIVHMDVFWEQGYDGILDGQVDMFFILYKLLKAQRILCCESGKVEIIGGDYNSKVLIPNIDLYD